MKKTYLKLIGTMVLSLIASQSFSQGNNWRINGNNNTTSGVNFLGTTNNQALDFRTNGIQRIHINEQTPFTPGYVGINTNAPQFQLHVVGAGIANNQDWTRGILISNDGALMWEGDPSSVPGTGTNWNFFMAHASNNPIGDFFEGRSDGIGQNAQVDYTRQVYVTTAPASGVIGSTRIIKDLYVQQDNNERRIGVNTLDPQATTEIANENTNNWQLRLTHQNNSWTDFKTRGSGNLNILPQNGNVGINMNQNPTHNLDVNGDARIRDVDVAATPDAIIVGTEVTGAGDYEVHRLDFTGNAGDVLLGDGTWGMASPALVANNGVSVNATNEIQLGVPCTIAGGVNGSGIIANSFTDDRVVPNRNFDLWFASGNNETGGVGFGGQFIGTPFCGTGNTVEISANAKNIDYGNTNASGLRFTKLTSASLTLANGTFGVDNSKVLTVDGDGDVVLVDVVGIGDYCSNSPVAPLSDDYLIEMDDKSYNFVSPSAGRINIGQVFCGLNADARVYIRNNNSFQVGIRSESLQPNGVGGWFEGDKYGVFAVASSNPSAPVPPAGNYAGYFDGDVHVTGTVYLANPAVVSDQVFKNNVNSINTASTIISQLNPVSYEYDQSFNSRMNFATGTQYGFIAQDVEAILPSLVFEGEMAEVRDSLGNVIDSAQSYKAVNYNGLFAILTKGIQEQQLIIEEQEYVISTQDSLINDLNFRLSSLESCLSNILPSLCQVNSTAIMQNDERA